MLALVIAVVRALARAVLVTLDLGQGVPPQVLGLVGRIDDGVRQALIAVQALGHLAEGIEFGEQVALVVARSPGAAVRVADLGHQHGQVVKPFPPLRCPSRTLYRLDYPAGCRTADARGARRWRRCQSMFRRCSSEVQEVVALGAQKYTCL